MDDIKKYIHSEFVRFPKTPRLNREIIITEKIDGANAQIFIEQVNPLEVITSGAIFVKKDGLTFRMRAGSRNRWVFPGNDDNFGFAAWVHEHAHELVELGPGRHYGEWWGKGIQRGYGLTKRRFSLFNVSRWNNENIPSCCHIVPVIYIGPFDTNVIETEIMERLKKEGSYAAPGFMNPEGIIVYHTAANALFKVTLENDASPKSKVNYEL